MSTGDVGEDTAPATWIGRVRTGLERTFPYSKHLPETQPAYVASWIYVFGVLTLGALAMIVLSGSVLAFRGHHAWDSWCRCGGRLHGRRRRR